jgi:hypothetical protein
MKKMKKMKKMNEIEEKFPTITMKVPTITNIAEQEIFGRYKQQLGEHFNTRVVGTGKEAFSFKMFEHGLVLKRANRGYIVLDKHDIWCLKDMINEFLKKTELGEAL